MLYPQVLQRDADSLQKTGSTTTGTEYGPQTRGMAEALVSSHLDTWYPDILASISIVLCGLNNAQN